MTDIMTFQNIDLSCWDTLYYRILIKSDFIRTSQLKCYRQMALYECYRLFYVFNINYNGQQNLIFGGGPRTSIGELSSTFYAEFRYVYIIFISGGISKIQRNLNAENSILRAH